MSSGDLEKLLYILKILENCIFKVVYRPRKDIKGFLSFD
jgi:hypothetical protein